MKNCLWFENNFSSHKYNAASIKQEEFLVFSDLFRLNSSHGHSNIRGKKQSMTWASRAHLHNPRIVWDAEIAR